MAIIDAGSGPVKVAHYLDAATLDGQAHLCGSRRRARIAVLLVVCLMSLLLAAGLLSLSLAAIAGAGSADWTGIVAGLWAIAFALVGARACGAAAGVFARR